MATNQHRLTGSTGGIGAGFSLIELMVAMLLGLVLLGGVTSLVVSMSRNHGEIQQKGELFDNGRYTSSLLADAIRHAGFYGRYDEPTVGSGVTSLPDPCTTTVSSIKDHLGLAVQGYDAPTGSLPLGCLADADHVDGTDILVIRRAARQETAVADLREGMIYIQGGFQDYRLAAAASDQSTNESTFDLTERDGDRTPIRRFRVDIFFVSPCLSKPDGSTCADHTDGDEPIPSLRQLELTVDGTDAAFEQVALTGGVDELQFDYGIDGNDDGQPDEASTSSAYLADPGSVSTWQNVVTVRVHSLGRTMDAVTGYEDERSYTLGTAGTVGPFNDAYKRHLFSRTARVVNRSSRRETE
jgi:type IV pilus assembly protein PilW